MSNVRHVYHVYRDKVTSAKAKARGPVMNLPGQQQHARADISRRAAAAMVKVLAEVVRKHKVQALAEASCICLMMDERALYYILR